MSQQNSGAIEVLHLVLEPLNLAMADVRPQRQPVDLVYWVGIMKSGVQPHELPLIISRPEAEVAGFLFVQFPLVDVHDESQEWQPPRIVVVVSGDTVEEDLLVFGILALGLLPQLVEGLGDVQLVFMGSASVVDISQMQDNVDPLHQNQVPQQINRIREPCAEISDDGNFGMFGDLVGDDSLLNIGPLDVVQFIGAEDAEPEIDCLQVGCEVGVVVRVFCVDVRLQLLLVVDCLDCLDGAGQVLCSRLLLDDVQLGQNSRDQAQLFFLILFIRLDYAAAKVIHYFLLYARILPILACVLHRRRQQSSVSAVKQNVPILAHPVFLLVLSRVLVLSDCQPVLLPVWALVTSIHVIVDIELRSGGTGVFEHYLLEGEGTEFGQIEWLPQVVYGEILIARATLCHLIVKLLEGHGGGGQQGLLGRAILNPVELGFVHVNNDYLQRELL